MPLDAHRSDRPSPPARPRFRLRAPAWETVALVLVAFALRVAYAWLAQGPHARPWSDAAEYDTVAWNLARGVGFRFDGAHGSYATAFVPPVVPWLVSLVYRVLGHWYFGALLLQCALGALVPLALGALARATWGSGVARVAAWLAVVHPLLVFFCGYLLTETTFTLALLLALLGSYAWVKTPRRLRAFGCGALWGVAILTRPTALPMPALVALWAWFPLGLTINGRERLRQLLLVALGIAVLVGPWTLRNGRELHAFVPVTTGGGRALLAGNNAPTWDDPAHRGEAPSAYDLEPYASKLHGRSEVEVDREASRMAKEFLLAHVHDWPQMAAIKLGRFWRLTSEGGHTGGWGAQRGVLGRLLAVVDPLLAWSLVVLPLALAGVALMLASARRLFLSLPLLVVAAATALTLLYWGSLRLRAPVEPLVLLYAGVAVDAAWKRWRVRRSGLRLVPGGR